MPFLCKRGDLAVYWGIAQRILASRKFQLVVISAIFGVVFLAPEQGISIGICLHRKIFGISCPGCGITRSIIAVAHGHFLAALRLHLGGPLVFLYFALLLLDRIMLIFFTRPLFGNVHRWSVSAVLLSITIGGWALGLGLRLFGVS